MSKTDPISVNTAAITENIINASLKIESFNKVQPVTADPIEVTAIQNLVITSNHVQNRLIILLNISINKHHNKL